MSPLKLGKSSLTITNNEIYVIAEIGQNHQGNLDVAKEMISEAKVNIKTNLRKKALSVSQYYICSECRLQLR